jgi:hypothetical protein
VVEPATNYIPKEQLDKKQKEKAQIRNVAQIAEGFTGRDAAAREADKNGMKTNNTFPTYIPRATADSNAKEKLTMRR